MKTNHQNLIKLLYDNRETIDNIYKNPNSVNISNVNPELLKKGVVLQLGKIVNLNPFYRQFVNTILLKVDYSILFGNFDEHSKEIISLKNRYKEDKKYSYIKRIKKLLYDLYTSVILQDKQIESLLYDMENQISVELDQLIEEASFLLGKVEKYLKSIQNILNDLDEDLASIHIDIEEVIDDINHSIEPYIIKIKSYCNRFSDLIRISEEKKALNQKLFSLAAAIIQGNDDYLVDYLIENQNELAFHVHEEVLYIPYSEKDQKSTISRLKSFLNIPQVPIKKTIKRKKLETKEIVYIDEEKIISDLVSNGCDDLYLFLLNHPEIKKVKSSKQGAEAFRMFLLLCINKEYPLIKNKDFNDTNIRRVSWQ